jgi:hypothetical protein
MTIVRGSLAYLVYGLGHVSYLIETILPESWNDFSYRIGPFRWYQNLMVRSSKLQTGSFGPWRV